MGRRVVSRRSFILGGGLAAALVLLAFPRWEAMRQRSGVYSDTYTSTY
jgi:hypothetical protein